MAKLTIRDPDLIEAIDRLVHHHRHRHPGRRITREGLARELLYAAVQTKQPRSHRAPVGHAASD